MKVIDLLNKIANGEEAPKKIKKQWVYEYKYDDIRDKYTYMQNTGERFDDDWLICEILNNEVEIIEEEKKIPEKINNGYTKQSIVDMKEARFNSNDMAKICNRIGWLMENRNELSNKIDEIIDYLKSKGE